MIPVVMIQTARFASLCSKMLLVDGMAAESVNFAPDKSEMKQFFFK